jgi:hypothetical protein
MRCGGTGAAQVSQSAARVCGAGVLQGSRPHPAGVGRRGAGTSKHSGQTGGWDGGGDGARLARARRKQKTGLLHGPKNGCNHSKHICLLDQTPLCLPPRRTERPNRQPCTARRGMFRPRALTAQEALCAVRAAALLPSQIHETDAAVHALPRAPQTPISRCSHPAWCSGADAPKNPEEILRKQRLMHPPRPPCLLLTPWAERGRPLDDMHRGRAAAARRAPPPLLCGGPCMSFPQAWPFQRGGPSWGPAPPVASQLEPLTAGDPHSWSPS